MLPSRPRGTAGSGAHPGAARGRPSSPRATIVPGRPGLRAAASVVLPLSAAICYVAAGAVNAADLVFGRRPSVAGAVWSAVYVTVWLACAVQAGRSRHSRQLRWTAVFWAVVIGGTALCGAFLRLNLGTGAAIPGGWVAPAVLLVVAAPLYGLVGLLHVEPLLAMLGVALGAAVLTMALALVARRLRPLTGTAG